LRSRLSQQVARNGKECAEFCQRLITP
jgi:hypothetical protein